LSRVIEIPGATFTRDIPSREFDEVAEDEEIPDLEAELNPSL
jgi:hypothetical protein